jgi:Helix-turn-helix domain
MDMARGAAAKTTPVEESAQAPAPTPTATVNRARRLTDDERARILTLHADGMNNSKIAAELKTSVGTVGNVLRNAGIAGRSRRGSGPLPMSDLQRRFMLLGFERVQQPARDDDSDEVKALRTIYNDKVKAADEKAKAAAEAARKAALDEALANLAD